MKLLLVFTLLTGIFAEECSLGDLGIEDFADKVVVTNTSTDADAWVSVKSNHGRVAMMVSAGKSRTVVALASTDYNVTVTNPQTREYGSYKDNLLAARDVLLDVTIAAHATENAVAAAWTQLVFVQAALDQMAGSNKFQSCSGKLKTDVPSQVTVQLLYAADGTPLWALDCG